MAETLAASRWPRCRRLVVPPARLCPDHPVRMKAAGVAPLGEVVSLTTLHSPPEGFRAPLHIAPLRAGGRSPPLLPLQLLRRPDGSDRAKNLTAGPRSKGARKAAEAKWKSRPK